MRIVLLSLVLGCAGAPANLPPRVVEPPPKKVVEKPAVRWVYARPAVSLGRARELSAGKSLFAALEGQRWLRSGAAWSHAERPLPEDLVGVLGGDTFDYVGASGTVYRTNGPLGDALETRPASYSHATASDTTILAITKEHTLVRSVDRGVTYAAVNVAEGAVVDVVLSRDGRGLALLAPERVFVTRDHGATWTRGALPDLDPEGLSIADDGAPYVGTAARGAKLAASGFAAPSVAEAAAESGPRVAAIAVNGARVVVVAHEKGKEPTVAVTTLDGERTFKPIAGLGACHSVLAAAASDHVAVACVRREPESLAVARSFDQGKTFRLTEALPFAIPSGYLRARVSLAAGSKGMLAYSDGYHIRWIKKEGETPVEIGKDLSVGALTLDEARARIVAAGDHLLSAPLDGGKVEKLGELESIEDEARLAIDDDGRVHLAYGNFRGLQVVHDGITKGYPLKQPRIALAGGRGLVAVGPRLYETSDGGEHLRDIGRAPAGPFACGAAGCAFASASRIGWGETGTSIAAQPNVNPPPEATPSPTIVACKPVGAPIRVAVGTPEPAAQLVPSPSVPFRAPTQLGVVSGTFDKPTVSTLFAPTKRKAMVVFHSVSSGFVAMRYLVAPKTAQSAGLRAISLDLAWRRDSEKAVHKATTGDVGTFRILVGAVTEDLHWPYAAGIVDGGVIVRTAHPFIAPLKETMPLPLFETDDDPLMFTGANSGNDPFLFVRDNGKVETVTPPPDVPVVSAIYRSNGRWVVVSRANEAKATVWISSDEKGTSWQRRSVGLWPGAATITLSETAGKPAFVVVPADGKRGFVATLSLDGARGLDVRSFGIPALDRKHACGTLDPGAHRANVKHEGLDGRVGDDRVALDNWVLSVPPTGDACVAAVGGSLYDRGLFVGLGNPKRSLWFLRNEHVQSVDCPL